MCQVQCQMLYILTDCGLSVSKLQKWVQSLLYCPGDRCLQCLWFWGQKTACHISPCSFPHSLQPAGAFPTPVREGGRETVVSSPEFPKGKPDINSRGYQRPFLVFQYLKTGVRRDSQNAGAFPGEGRPRWVSHSSDCSKNQSLEGDRPDSPWERHTACDCEARLPPPYFLLRTSHNFLWRHTAPFSGVFLNVVSKCCYKWHTCRSPDYSVLFAVLRNTPRASGM